MLADERRSYVLDKFMVIGIYGEVSASPVMLLCWYGCDCGSILSP